MQGIWSGIKGTVTLDGKWAPFVNYEFTAHKRTVAGEAPVILGKVRVNPSAASDVSEQQPILTSLLLTYIVNNSGKKDAISDVHQFKTLVIVAG